MIEVHQIRFGYKKGESLFNPIDLSVTPGEIVGIYGKSGLGKTTLAKIIAGYIQPDSGTVSIDGKSYPVKGRNPIQLIGQHPEKAVNPRWRMNRTLLEADALDSKLLQDLKIQKEWLLRYPSQLSGGELQRFCVARALHPKTQYIIADEITTMLDALSQAHIWQVLCTAVQQRNLGILAISHNRELLTKISNRYLDFTPMAYSAPVKNKD